MKELGWDQQSAVRIAVLGSGLGNVEREAV